MIVPWKKIGDQEVLAEGFGKTFTRQRFRDHNDTETEFFFFDQPSWSVILPVTTEGEVIIVRQFKQGVEAILEELPGGTAHGKERAIDVIQRELKEETGYEAGTIISLGDTPMNSRNSRTRAHYFLGVECTKTVLPSPDSNEQIEIYTVPLEEWVRRVFTTTEVQWDSVVVTLRALPHLGYDVTKIL